MMVKLFIDGSTRSCRTDDVRYEVDGPRFFVARFVASLHLSSQTGASVHRLSLHNQSPSIHLPEG